MPHTLVLIYALLVLVWIAAWLVPSGAFERQTVTVAGSERSLTVPGTYRQIEKPPVSPFLLLTAPLKGFVDAAPIIIFLFTVGGAFAVLTATGTVDLSIRRLASFFGRKPALAPWLIPVMMVIFSLAGSVFGMSEETIPFIVVFIPLSIGLGYDSIVGLSIPFLGAAAGFAAAFFNPFTVGIAQGIAGLPLYSGLAYRIVAWVLGTGVMITFVMIYARKIKRDPRLSPVYEHDEFWRKRAEESGEKSGQWNGRHRLVLLVLALGVAALIFGILRYQWYIEEIAALFLALGLLCGLVGRVGMNETARQFVAGARDMIGVALIIACARGVLIIANEARILDTVLESTAGLISVFPKALAAQIMFLTQSMINFFIHSGTAQAALTMPVMAPLGDLVGVSRQTSVLAFQLCEFILPILPTSAVTMGVLGMARISWSTWARWFFPLMLILVGLSVLLLLPPVLLFNWGPF
ncbi:MAG: YfcC family protein [Candidatus Krumholzibacteriia bacterium]